MKSIWIMLSLALISRLFAAEEFENVWQQEGKWRFEPVRAGEKYLDDVYGIDVEKYHLYFDVCDTVNKVTQASALIEAMTVTDNLNLITLDFQRKIAGNGYNVVVDSIIFDAPGYTNLLINQETSLDWSGDKRIKVALPAALTAGTHFKLKIVYHGSNLTVYYSDFKINLGIEYKLVANKAVIQTLSCPEGSGSWFPCKDLPSDKALFTTRIRSWSHQKAVSNGKLISETLTGDDKKLTQWQTAYQQSTYLNFFAVSSFKIYEQTYTSLDGLIQMPVLNYLYPSTYNSSLTGLAQMPDMIHALALKLGEYPFISEKAGNVSYVLGGGMEHQTIPAIQSSTFSEMLLLHELAHQWIGDQSTCKTWNDAWINEGGASYCEALWKEYKLGFTGYKNWMNGFKTTATSSSANKSLYGYLPTFGGVIYHKGAWVYHMLRYVLGDDVYFAAQKKLLSQSAHSYASISTDEFFNFFSQESGLNLNRFKEQWVLKGGYPKYSVAYQAENSSSASIVRFQLKQTQTLTELIPLFKMPVPVKVVYEDNTDTLLVLQDSLAYQEFAFNLPKPAKSAMTIDLFNYDDKVLCSKTLVPFTGIESDKIADGFSLEQNYPNPFNNSTSISFVLPQSGSAKVSIFNAKGEFVKEILNQDLAAGWHSVDFHADNFNSGVYFYRLNYSGRILERKLVLIK